MEAVRYRNARRYHVENPLCCAYDRAADDDSADGAAGGACESTEAVWNVVATEFACEIDPSAGAPAAARRCYLNQKHLGDEKGFPFTCHVGNCLYDNTTKAPDIPVVDHSTKPQPAVSAWTFDLGHPVETLHAHQFVLLALVLAAVLGCSLRAFLTSPLRSEGRRIEGEIALDFAATEDELDATDDEGLDLAWRGVGLACGAALLVKDADGEAPAGEVCCVLGPSGAGKSSLLRAIGGRAPRHSRQRGTVEVGGKALPSRARRATLAFVEQDDAGLPPALTVAEHLLFHARLRRPAAETVRERTRAVRRVLRTLELEACAGTFLGARGNDDEAPAAARGCSGGEARRASVAAELLGAPAALLLDEPTSRLDARAALRLMRALKRVARRGGGSGGPVAVLCTLHQPRSEILGLVDRCCFIADGVVVWRGATRDVRALAVRLGPPGANPGDALLDALCADPASLGDAPEEVRARRLVPATVVHAARFRRAGRGTQLRALADRQLLRVARAPSSLLLHLVGAVLAAVCLGTVDADLPQDLGGAQRRVGAIFFALFFVTCLSLSALAAFREEAACADSERAALGGLYGRGAHLAAVLGCDLVLLRLAPALALSLVVYPAAGLRPRCASWCVLRFAAAVVGASATAGCLCLALGAARIRAEVANAAGALGALLMALFGGVAVSVESRSQSTSIDVTKGGSDALAALGKAATRAAAGADALFHAYRAAVVGEFAGARYGDEVPAHIDGAVPGGPQYYVIDAHKCDPTFPSDLYVTVTQILATLGLPTSSKAADAALLRLGLVLLASLGVAALAHALRSPADVDDRAEKRPFAEPAPGAGDVEAPVPTDDVLETPLLEDHEDDDGVEGEAGRLACSGVHLKLGTGRVILDQVSLEVAAGGLTGLLGPSGAGKSSLLAVLSGRRTSGESSGLVALDGAVATPAQRRFAASFAPQDDILPPQLTIAEHLRFHARLRLPARWPKARACARALREAEALGLRGAALHATYLGRCSGGQRRRATLATALLARRRFVLADEPTTGLDAATALKVMGHLATLATRGVTVVCVLHQPRREIVRLLDRVALVAGGRLRFLGAPATIDAVVSDAANPADDLLDLSASAERLAALEAPARPLPFRGAFVAPAVPAARRPPRFYATLRLLAARAWRGVRRDASLLALHYGPAVAVGLVLGVAFANLPARNGSAAGIQDRLGLAFVLCVAVGLSALSAPPRARRAARLLARERDSYGGPAAFLAMCGVGDVLPLRLVPPVLTAALALAISRAAPTGAAGLGFVAAALQLHYAFAALGRCIGSLSPSDSVANAAASLVFLFNLLLCGFFADPDDLPPAWRRVGRALPAASGYEALVIHEFSGVPELYLTSKVGAQHIRSAPLAGDAVLRCFGFDPAAAPAAHLQLFLFAVAYECLTCFVFFYFGFEER